MDVIRYIQAIRYTTARYMAASHRRSAYIKLMASAINSQDYVQAETLHTAFAPRYDTCPSCEHSSAMHTYNECYHMYVDVQCDCTQQYGRVYDAMHRMIIEQGYMI